MAKKSSEVVFEEAEETPSEDTPAVSGKINIVKYYELYMPDEDKYMRAYRTEQFRGELNTPDEWASKLKNLI